MYDPLGQWGATARITGGGVGGMDVHTQLNVPGSTVAMDANEQPRLIPKIAMASFQERDRLQLQRQGRIHLQRRIK